MGALLLPWRGGGNQANAHSAIVLEYQVAAADRLRNTSVSSAFTYKEHRRAIAGAMGFVDPKDVDALELAWKISTAKKNELPAEFSGPKDLIKITNAYRAAVEKEEKKKADWGKKVKEGKTAGKKAPVPQDIVIVISNVGDGPKKVSLKLVGSEWKELTLRTGEGQKQDGRR